MTLPDPFRRAMVDLSNADVSRELAQDRDMLYTKANHTLGLKVQENKINV
jgi:hypothetical protein